MSERRLRELERRSASDPGDHELRARFFAYARTLGYRTPCQGLGHDQGADRFGGMSWELKWGIGAAIWRAPPFDFREAFPGETIYGFEQAGLYQADKRSVLVIRDITTDPSPDDD